MAISIGVLMEPAPDVDEDPTLDMAQHYDPTSEAGLRQRVWALHDEIMRNPSCAQRNITALRELAEQTGIEGRYRWMNVRAENEDPVT